MSVIVAVIILAQLYYFFKNKGVRSAFINIFPSKAEDEWTIRRQGDVQILSRDAEEYLAKLQEIEASISDQAKRRETLLAEQKRAESRLARYTADEFGNYPDGYYSDSNRIKTIKAERSTITKSLKSLEDQKQQNLASINSLNEKLNDTTLTRNIIILSINKYLIKNKDCVTDFNLIKDIVDRNCDAKEEEILTQNPIPLYLGLVGTMAGIIVGVLVLLFSGALANMMSTFDPTTIPGYPNVTNDVIDAARKAYEATATSGVQALLEGVGIAMISSILGIILTTISSIKTKDAKSEMEEKKHNFLSWMQAELLPKISSDVSSALVKLGKDLNGFNSTFSNNAHLLQNTINSVTAATTQQTNLLNAIQRLDVARVVEANISIYDNLRNCSVQLRAMGESMQHVKDGVKEVSEELATQIDDYAERLSYVQDASGKVDIAISEAQKQLAASIAQSFTKYKELVDNLYLDSEKYAKQASANYEKELDNLHQAIVNKLTDLKKLEDELKNLSAVKENIASLEKTTARQSEKLDKLAQSITALANAKLGATGAPTLPVGGSFMPKWAKVCLWILGGSTWAWLIAWTVLTMIK